MTRNARQAYREPFRRWDDVSWIRKGELRTGALSGLMFSPDLVPLVSHPLLRDDPRRYERALAYRLATHLHFTTVLELEHVNVVCSDLAQGRAPVLLDLGQRNDALRIYCDEGGHALFVELLLSQVEERFGISRDVIGRPYFDEVLTRIIAESPVSERLTRLLFVSVSETLVSKILLEMPDDQRVCPTVRSVIADHAADESRHSTYFQWLFPRLWTGIRPRQVEAVATMLAEFLLAFLGPDRECDLRVLHDLDFDRELRREIMDTVYAAPTLSESISAAAQPTLRMFANAGLFDVPAAQDIFVAHGLVLEEG
jgi:hypothetical protein